MVWLNALARHFQAQVIQARERAQVRAIKSSIGHVEVFQMDGVGTPIIGRPRPLPGHDTPNPTHHPQMRRTHKPRNINDQISTREIQSRELRATLLGNQPDWKPTHETTYQHTRRRCDGRRMDRRARASFATRRRAKRDRQVSRADGPSDARNNARAATTRGPLHPLRGATPDQKGCTAYGSGAARPITRTNEESARRRPTQRGGRCTRYGARHPLRGATPDQKRCTAYGTGAAHPITRTNAESARRSPTRTRPRELALPEPQLSSSSANAPRRAVAAVGDGDAGGGQAVAQLVGAAAFG